jgi:hypothetical protein
MATFAAFVMSRLRLMTVSRCSSYSVIASRIASKSDSLRKSISAVDDVANAEARATTFHVGAGRRPTRAKADARATRGAREGVLRRLRLLQFVRTHAIVRREMRLAATARHIGRAAN